MGWPVKVRFKGNRLAIRAVDRVISAIDDLSPSWGELHAYLLIHAQQQERTSGSYGGQRWQGFGGERVYAAFKLATDGHLRPLEGAPQDEVYLNSFQSSSSPWHIFRPNAAAMAFGSSLFFGVDLEEGGVGPFGEPFPARPVLSYTSAQEMEMAEIVLADIVRRAMFDA